jgi:hypothetical protein
MLKFSAKLARVIAKDKGLARFPRKYILSGVFIPGIRHLLEEYTLPQGRNMLQAKCLAVCGDYPSAASFDYPNGFWWKFLLALAELIGGPPLLASMPLNVSGQVHDYVVVFHNLDRRCGIVACEQMVFGDKWMKEAALAVDKHAEEYGLQSTVLVAHSRKDEGATEDVSFEFVISDNPTEAAESIARRWAKTLP